MKLGIKVGPRQNSITDLKETHAPFAEVWFRIDKQDDYTELFSYLIQQKIDTGLHFWGLTHDGLVPGIAYDDPRYIHESIDLFKQTIDIAAKNGFSYVNIHPGFQTRVACEYTNLIFSRVDDCVTPYEQAARIFLEHVDLLDTYAKQNHVLLTVETTPLMVQSGSLHDKTNRASVDDFKEFSYLGLPVETLQFAIANDFGHTAANCISQTPEPVWDFLLQKTIALAPQTKLLHIGYIVPPFNGTDFHDQMDNPIFETNRSVPNKNQILELLKLFKHRDDVRGLVEPDGQHPKNYFLTQKLLANA